MDRAPTIKPRRLLIVDDHADSAAYIARLLAHSGHTVVDVNSYDQALQLASQACFDVLISDIGLGEKDGRHLLQELTKKHPIKGIAISAYTYPTDAERSLEAGFLKHITKPFKIGALLDAIEAI